MGPGSPARDSRASDRWKLHSTTAPTLDSEATANMTAMAPRPNIVDIPRSVVGMTDMRASLMVSFATRGRDNWRAKGGARVVLPLAGGPETMTN